CECYGTDQSELHHNSLLRPTIVRWAQGARRARHLQRPSSINAQNPCRGTSCVPKFHFMNAVRRRGETAGQYLSKRLISMEIEAREEVPLVRGKSGRISVEGAERALGTAVPVPAFHYRRLGSDDPDIQDPALSNSGSRRRHRGFVAGLAGTGAAVVANHLCNDLWFSTVGCVRHSRGDADRGIKDGGKLRLSAAGLLPIGAENRDRAAVRGLVRLRHLSQGHFCVSAWIFPGGGIRRAGLQIRRSRYGGSGSRHAGQPVPC